MVKTLFRLIPLLAVALLPIANLSAKNLADYQIGDKAEEDIVTPSKLTIVDPEGTEAMKQKEAQRVAVVIRFYTNTADNVEAQFRAAFGETRSNFIQSITKAFGHPTLSAEELSSPHFDSVAASFQKQNKLFPLNPNRAALWATGDLDEGYEATLASMLRKAMSPPIRPEPIPAGIKLGTTVRILALEGTNETMTTQEAQKQGKGLARSNFVAIAQVRKDFQNLFDFPEHDVAKYLSTLLIPNCEVDEDLTQQFKIERTEGLWAVTTYEAGDVIAHRGQVIDKKVKAALDQLKEKVVVSQLQDLQAKQQATVGQLQQIVANDKAKVVPAPDRTPWLIGALATVVLILAVTIWQLSRRRQTISLLPVPAAGTGTALDWQQRALTAEQTTAKLQNAARAGLIAHLSEWLSRAFTQRLVSQRRLLIEAQTNAAAEMAELDARLAKIQAPLQDRLLAYEKRIAELEKELAARGEENRTLLKAKIEMMRKQLEAERGKNRLEFN